MIASYVFYDSKCSFCVGTVNTIKRNLKNSESVLFEDLRTPSSRMILNRHGVKFIALNTIYYLSGSNVSMKSKAILKLLQLTRYSAIAALLLRIPQSASDKLYEYVSKNRYKISSLLAFFRVRSLRTK